MNGRYILDGKETIACDDLMTWGEWMQSGERHVAKETVGESDVSTVFLGLDHDFTGEGPPIVFETMVFGGALDQEQARYETWEQAEAGHAAMVELVKAEQAAS